MVKLLCIALFSIPISLSVVSAQEPNPIHSASPDSMFISATSLSFDLSGNRYVIDETESIIQKFSRDCKRIGGSGGYGWSDAALDRPKDIATPNDLDVYVADYGNHRIQRFDRNLNIVSSIPSSAQEGEERPFGYPRSVAISRFGSLFITDGENTRIVKYVDDNTLERTFGNVGIGDARLQSPSRVRVSAHDLVYVQDLDALKVFDYFGNYVQTIGKNLSWKITAFTIDGDDLYIADSSVIYRMVNKGAIDTLVTYRSAFPGGILDIAVCRDTLYALERNRISVLTPLPLNAKK